MTQSDIDNMYVTPGSDKEKLVIEIQQLRSRNAELERVFEKIEKEHFATCRHINFISDEIRFLNVFK